MSLNNESKHDRFVRIAESRTNKAAEKIRLLGNCSNKSTYEYSEEEIHQIFAFLDREIRNAKNRFNGTNSDEGRFILK